MRKWVVIEWMTKWTRLLVFQLNTEKTGRCHNYTKDNAVYVPGLSFYFYNLKKKKSLLLSFYCDIQTVVLERTVESPWDCKEIKPVNPKGNQPWIFIGRNWCWSWSSNTLAIWCNKLTHWKRTWYWRSGRQRMRWLDGITDSIHQFEQTPGDGEGQGTLVCCSPWGHNWATEPQTAKQMKFSEMWVFRCIY